MGVTAKIRTMVRSKEGYTFEITVENVANHDVRETLINFSQFLKGNAFTAIPEKSDQRASDQREEADQFPPIKLCPIHNVYMQLRKKGDEVWYSHKVTKDDGSVYWCKGK